MIQKWGTSSSCRPARERHLVFNLSSAPSQDAELAGVGSLQSPVRPRIMFWSCRPVLTFFLHTPKVNTWDCPKRASVLQAPQTGQCCRSPLSLMAGMLSSATSAGRGEGSQSRQGTSPVHKCYLVKHGLSLFGKNRNANVVQYMLFYINYGVFLMEQHNLKSMYLVYIHVVYARPLSNRNTDLDRLVLSLLDITESFSLVVIS